MLEPILQNPILLTKKYFNQTIVIHHDTKGIETTTGSLIRIGKDGIELTYIVTQGPYAGTKTTILVQWRTIISVSLKTNL